MEHSNKDENGNDLDDDNLNGSCAYVRQKVLVHSYIMENFLTTSLHLKTLTQKIVRLPKSLVPTNTNRMKMRK